MMLTFSPALGSTTTLEVPPTPAHTRGRPLALCFKATFDSPESYAKAKADGVRVELWTNLPVEGTPSGDWNAVAFSELQDTSSHDAAVEKFGTLEEHTVYLLLRAPLQDQVGARFQFTYRVVYPSGQVQWLGAYGNNGVLGVKQGLAGIDLVGGWDVGADGAFHPTSSVVGGAVGRVSQMADWAIWTWNAAGVPTRLDDRVDVTSSALILLPRRLDRGVIVPEPVALVGDKTTRLRLSFDGTLSARTSEASGRLTFAALEHSLGLLEEALSAYGGAVIPCNSAFLAMATHHTNAALPVHLLVLPTSGAAQGTVSVPLNVLQPLVSGERRKTGLVLFTPDNRKLQMFRGPISDDDRGTLAVNSAGGTVVVSPVEVVTADEKTWSLSLLAPSTDMSWTIKKPHHPLPTPPPSPPVRQSSHPGSPSTTPVPPAIPQSAVPPHRPEHRRRASSALVRNLPARLLRAYIHAVFNVIFWFWNVLFRAVVVRLLGEGLPRRISGFLGLALAKTSARVRNPGQLQKGAGRDEGRQALLGSGDERHNREQATTYTATSDLPAPQPKHAPPRHQSHPVRIVPHVVFSASLEGGSELPFLVIQGDLTKGLHATLDGKALPDPTTARSDDGIYLVEFVGLPANGHLEVFLDL